MTMKFTVLCDNSAATASSVIAEHGFACFLESEEGNYLFDTGQGLGIVHNSIVLKKDLSKIKAIMLSHGHYDHTGGLAKVLQITGEINVYAHPDIFAKKYKEKTGRKLEYVTAGIQKNAGNVDIFIVPAKTFEDAEQGNIEAGIPMLIIPYKVKKGNFASGFGRNLHNIVKG